MIKGKDIFTGAWELYQAQEFFRPQTKNGQALSRPGGFLLPNNPRPTEELLASAYVRLLEMEAREEEIGSDFLDQAVIALDWAAKTQSERNSSSSRENYPLEERRSLLEEQVGFLTTEAKGTAAGGWQKTLKTMLRGHVWAICQNSPFDYRGGINKLTGIENLLKRSVLQESKSSKSQ
ncbi:MAG: hypothetical protein PHR64_00195 [Candidatus Shapirobacteria bacterium]|nr:hypothetical protein [Candidatus Shapirobacteria bacterium]MDD5073606.1 hypothetical protein [Candidatus Shapirobacteria bacterium]MDD5481359.1 hypothetical protein [Candidatus Shapirobacteria bacterium]